MACSRRDCHNIMCDIYVPGIGYICHECAKEFSDLYASIVTDTSEIYTLLDDFTYYPRQYITEERRVSGEELIRKFFNEHE